MLDVINLAGDASTGETALHAACRVGSLSAVKVLMSTAAPGINMNVRDVHGSTPLLLACRHGHTLVVEQLLGMHQAAADGAESSGSTCSTCTSSSVGADGTSSTVGAGGVGCDHKGRHLHKTCACSRGANGLCTAGVETIGMQRTTGAAGGILHCHSSSPRAMRATKSGSRAATAKLSTSVDVNAANDAQRTPLAVAAWQGHDEVVNLLLAAPGLDMWAVDQHRFTALHAACHGGSRCMTVVHLLLDYACAGACYCQPAWALPVPRFQDGSSDHPSLTCSCMTYPRIQLNSEDSRGCTPLWLAAEAGCAASVQLLLSCPGVDANIADAKGRSVVAIAAEQGHEEILELLLSVPGIDLNATDEWGRTPLIAASASAPSSALALLCAHGIDVHAVDEDCRTALWVAAACGHAALIQRLMQLSGMDRSVQAVDRHGRSPLDIAAQRGHREVIKLLGL